MHLYNGSRRDDGHTKKVEMEISEETEKPFWNILRVRGGDIH